MSRQGSTKECRNSSAVVAQGSSEINKHMSFYKLILLQKDKKSLHVVTLFAEAKDLIIKAYTGLEINSHRKTNGYNDIYFYDYTAAELLSSYLRQRLDQIIKNVTDISKVTVENTQYVTAIDDLISSYLEVAVYEQYMLHQIDPNKHEAVLKEAESIMGKCHILSEAIEKFYDKLDKTKYGLPYLHYVLESLQDEDNIVKVSMMLKARQDKNYVGQVYTNTGYQAQQKVEVERPAATTPLKAAWEYYPKVELYNIAF